MEERRGKITGEKAGKKEEEEEKEVEEEKLRSRKWTREERDKPDIKALHRQFDVNSCYSLTSIGLKRALFLN